MEGKDPARSGVRVGVVPEQDLRIGRDIFEPASLWIDAQPFRSFGDVSRGLVRISAQCGAGGLGFDDAAEFLVDKQSIVAGACAGPEFADGNAWTGTQIETIARLDYPAARSELFIEDCSGPVFRMEGWGVHNNFTARPVRCSTPYVTRGERRDVEGGAPLAHRPSHTDMTETAQALLRQGSSRSATASPRQR